MRVPIKIYSVSFRSLDSFKSPNRNTDLAAIKKPMASQLSVIMKTKTNNRSKIPIYLPAFSRDSSELSPILGAQLDIRTLIIMEVGCVKKYTQIIVSKIAELCIHINE